MSRGKGSIFAFTIVLLIPIALGAYFMSKPRPTVDRLMIAGQRQLVDKLDSTTGETYQDTLFHSIADFKFVSHLGDTITKSHLDGKVLITDFFFTECPTICIDMSKNMGVLQEAFIDDEEVTLLSHTVDPGRDTVAKLFEYAERYDVNPKKWLLLTGDKKPLYKMARESYLISATIPGDGGPHDFIHDNHFVLVDKEGRVRGFYDGTSDEDVQRCIDETQKLLVSYLVDEALEGKRKRKEERRRKRQAK